MLSCDTQHAMIVYDSGECPLCSMTEIKTDAVRQLNFERQAAKNSAEYIQELERQINGDEPEPKEEGPEYAAEEDTKKYPEPQETPDLSA